MKIKNKHVIEGMGEKGLLYFKKNVLNSHKSLHTFLFKKRKETKKSMHTEIQIYLYKYYPFIYFPIIFLYSYFSISVPIHLYIQLCSYRLTYIALCIALCSLSILFPIYVSRHCYIYVHIYVRMYI